MHASRFPSLHLMHGESRIEYSVSHIFHDFSSEAVPDDKLYTGASHSNRHCGIHRFPGSITRLQHRCAVLGVSPKCTARPPRMDHPGWVYIGFSYIKYNRTSFIPFYYITEALNLRSHTRWPSWAPQWPKRPTRRPLSGGPAANTNEAARRPKIAIFLGKYRARRSRARSARGP
jgi:hypothetical protein